MSMFEIHMRMGSVFACNVVFLGSLPPSKSHFLPHLLLASFLLSPLPCTGISAVPDRWAVLGCCVCCNVAVHPKENTLTLQSAVIKFSFFFFFFWQIMQNIAYLCIFNIHTSYEISIQSAILFQKISFHH